MRAALATLQLFKKLNVFIGPEVVQCHAAIKNAGGQEVFKNTSLAALLRLK